MSKGRSPPPPPPFAGLRAAIDEPGGEWTDPATSSLSFDRRRRAAGVFQSPVAFELSPPISGRTPKEKSSGADDGTGPDREGAIRGAPDPVGASPGLGNGRCGRGGGCPPVGPAEPEPPVGVGGAPSARNPKRPSGRGFALRSGWAAPPAGNRQGANPGEAGGRVSVRPSGRAAQAVRPLTPGESASGGLSGRIRGTSGPWPPLGGLTSIAGEHHVVFDLPTHSNPPPPG